MTSTLFVNARAWQWADNHKSLVSLDWVLVQDGLSPCVAGSRPNGRPGRVSQCGSSPHPDPASLGVDVAVVDLKGATMLPGLQDAHIHIFHLGEVRDHVL